MGLAASQARFLAITSRKMNCEFQSMQIAQEKLSVTRDLQRASQNYQNSLNATKLVWDTQDDDVYDLSYALMMTPSTLNEYDPYLITDTQGKILLTESMFKAAKNAGIIDSKGNPTGNALSGDFFYDNDGKVVINETLENAADGTRNRFLKELTKLNQIESSTVESILSLGYTGYTKSGIGGAVYDKTTANALKTNGFISYMKEITYEKANEQGIAYPEDIADDIEKRKEKIYALKLTDIDSSIIGNLVNNDKNLSDKSYLITQSGRSLSKDTVENLTVGDLLTGKYDITFKNSNANYKDIFDELLNQISKALGKGDVGIKGLNVDIESDMALDDAYIFTQQNRNSTTSCNSKTVSDLCTAAEKTNNIIVGQDNTYCLSLTNLAKSYLTNFVIAIEGFDSGYTIKQESAKESKYVTSDPDYYFLLKKDSAMTDNTMLNADFYNMLYNQIATNGAIADSKVRELYTLDQNNLHQALKNGNLFISSLHNDGYFYQGAYTLSGHIAEVTDEEAISRAEIEYTVQKAKLNNKEESLELQMKNLDMEISSLTTELDSVKNLISKNVEKVFTMFSS